MVCPLVCLHVLWSGRFLLGDGNECGHILLVVHVQIITRCRSWFGLDLHFSPGCFLWIIAWSACSGFTESTCVPRAVMCNVECGASRSHSVLGSCWRSWLGGLCRGAQCISRLLPAWVLQLGLIASSASFVADRLDSHLRKGVRLG
jgi:hypothetical protein